jgi:hypothetical protein
MLAFPYSRRHDRLGSNTGFLRSWGNPDQEALVANQAIRRTRYLHLWDLYEGTAFDDIEFWQDYKGKFALYRQIRLLWDHVHTLVEFYATHVWYGSLAQDGMNLPNGVLNAIPLAQDTEPAVAEAIGMALHLWGFQKKMVQIPRYAAALGELLVEIHDKPEEGPPQAELIWPTRVEELRLGLDGDVEAYSICYQADRPDGSSYLYRREVDKERFIIYEDASVVDEYPNPYGFTPAVWFRHIPKLGVRGEPALYSTQGQLDELNGLFSNLFDKSHLSLRAPVVVSGNISPSAFQRALSNMVGTVKRAATADLAKPHAGREELNILQGPQGTTISTIELKISEALKALEQMIASIERKCPEVTFYEQLRGMTQLTGPAASRLLGDVDKRLQAVASTHDVELHRLLGKGIAIMGMRASEGLGVWAGSREDLQKFAPFSPESYLNNEIKFDILPRPLVPSTQMENLTIIETKQRVLPFFPPEQAGREAGYDEDLVAGWITDWERKKAQEEAEALEKQIQVAEASRPPGAPPGGPQRGTSSGPNRQTLPGRREI